MRKIVLFLCFLHAFCTFSNANGSVVFSEIMMDPEPAVGLPAVEYIELYNSNMNNSSLKGWTLYYGEKAYAFPAVTIESKNFCILCSKTAAAMFSSNIPVVAFESFPILGNSGKQIYLLNEKKELVCFLEYSPEWHSDVFKAKGGWSLECIDLDNLSGDASNWTSSNDINGGTPGYKNSVASVNPDETPPLLTGVYIPSPMQVEMTFSKSLNTTTLKSFFKLKPEGFDISSVTSDFPANRSVTLHLNETLSTGTIYDLSISGLTDVSGLLLVDTFISFGLPEPPDFFDLSLNEVLFNPLPGGVDYVEFVNISEKCVDLSQLWLTSKKLDGSLNEGVRLSVKPMPCLPGSYWLLSVCKDSVLAMNGLKAIPHSIDLPGFPSLPDDSGNVLLVTNSAQVIDEMDYQEKMHFPLISQREGVSLEKKNPMFSSMDSESWTSASTTSNYGTPGFPNSQYRGLNAAESEGFHLQKSWLTPDNDGLDDGIEIVYQVAESTMASLTIYDLNGRIVKDLVKNELLNTNGSVFWDGTANDRSMVPFGRYVLSIEYFAPSGHVFKKRFVLTVLF